MALAPERAAELAPLGRAAALLPATIPPPSAPAALPPLPSRTRHGPWVVIGAVMVGYFMGPLYSSVANVALPNLVAAFGSDVDTMQWVITGYMLGYSITMPVAGWAADAFGRRTVFIAGIATFTLCSIGCALAWDGPSLIALRILQAVGGGLVSPSAMAIVIDVVPAKDRGKALGIWGLGMMLAPAFGPLVSGAIIDTFDDWRLIFAVGVPIGLAGCALAYFFIPREEDRTRTRVPFDVAGALLLATSLAALLVPLSQVDRIGWDDPAVEGSFALSVLAFAGFIWRELTAPAPMLDLALFRAPTFAVAVALRAAMGMGYYLPLFLMPLFTQNVMGWPPTISGLILVPGGVATALLMPLSGWLSDKIGARPLVFSGMALSAVGSFMFVHLDTSWTPTHIATDMIVRSAALGLLFTPLTAAALSVVPRARTGSASGIINTVWQVAGSIGIAVGETYLTARTAVHLSENAGTVTAANGTAMAAMQTFSGLAQRYGLPAATAHALLEQTTDGVAAIAAYGDTFVFGALVLAVATPLALLLRRGR